MTITMIANFKSKIIMTKMTKKERTYFWTFVLVGLCLACVLDGRNSETLPNQQQERLNEYARYAEKWSEQNLGRNIEPNIFCSINGNCSILIENTQNEYNLVCSRYTQSCVRETSND